MPMLRWLVGLSLLLLFVGFQQPIAAQIDPDDFAPITADNIDELEVVAVLELPPDALYMDRLAFNGDGSLLAATNNWGHLWYWDLATGELTILRSDTICDCEPSVNFVDNSTDILHSHGEVWNINTGEQTTLTEVAVENAAPVLLRDRLGNAHDIAYTFEYADPSHLIQTLVLVNIETGDRVFFPYVVDLSNPYGYSISIYDLTISEDGQYIATTARITLRQILIHTVEVYDLQGNVVGEAPANDRGMTPITSFIEISPDSQYYLYGVNPGTIYLGPIANDDDIPESQSTGINERSGFYDAILGLVVGYDIDTNAIFSADSTMVIATDTDGVWAYDIEAGEARLVIEIPLALPPTVFYHHNLIAVGDENNNVVIFGIPATDE